MVSHGRTRKRTADRHSVRGVGDRRLGKAEDLAADLCRRFPDHGNLTLAKRLHKEHPAVFPTVDTARTAIRYRRGCVGKKNLAKLACREHVRPCRKPGQMPKLPDSVAQSWEPFVIDTRRSLVISDLHIPHQDNLAIKAALDYGQEFKPDSILINGDLFDFYQISRFDKNPTLPKVSSELLAGGQFFDHLRARFPKSKLYFKLGNHDERWAKYLYNAAPLLSDIPEIVDGWQGPAGVVRNKVTVIGEQRPIMLGKLMVLHGHEKGKGVNSPVNPARGAFLRLLTNVLEGHGHRQSEHEERTADDRLIVCRTTACLCGLWPDYAKCNKWGHGFATVTVAKNGEYQVELKRIRHGKVY